MPELSLFVVRLAKFGEYLNEQRVRLKGPLFEFVKYVAEPTDDQRKLPLLFFYLRVLPFQIRKSVASACKVLVHPGTILGIRNFIYDSILLFLQNIHVSLLKRYLNLF